MFAFSWLLVLLSVILFTFYPQIFAQPAIESVIKEYLVPPGSHPHDVAPASNGSVWYTAQHSGELGLLDPISGKTQHIGLGQGSAPHGVIVGPDDAPWITDGGLNAIVRVDPSTSNVTKYQIPERFGNVNLNTATFDNRGILWFTGQGGIYGRLDPSAGNMEVYNAPRGPGPYGISTTPEGEVYYASLAGSYIGNIDLESGNVTILEPPTPDQGARRVWADSTNRIWFTEWNVGNLGMYDPDTNSWKEWKLPGQNPQPYAIFVDDTDLIWISDFGSNAMVTFDPAVEKFQSFQIPSSDAQVRQLLGEPGEVLGAESATDKIMIIQNNK
jgi:virginiamycin B lyase